MNKLQQKIKQIDKQQYIRYIIVKNKDKLIQLVKNNDNTEMLQVYFCEIIPIFERNNINIHDTIDKNKIELLQYLEGVR
jgi:tellurite resistance protein